MSVQFVFGPAAISCRKAGAQSGGHLHRRTELCFGLLGNLQCVINLNSEIPHRTFEPGMPEEQLDSAQVLGPAVDEGCFGAPQCVSSVCGRILSDRADRPVALDSPCVARCSFSGGAAGTSIRISIRSSNGPEILLR